MTTAKVIANKPFLSYRDKYMANARCLHIVTSVALLSLSTVAIRAANFPACPNWTHQLTFVNHGQTSAWVRETPGCFARSISDPPFNGSRCWPFQTKGDFEVKPGTTNAVKVTVPSCWSGNFGVRCDSCSTGVKTLAEFTFDGGLDAQAKKLPGLIDTYDVSLVDGFTKALRITPDMNVPAGGGTCTDAGCRRQPVCPQKLTDGDACVSPNQYVISHSSEFTETEREKYGCVCSVTMPLACTDDPLHTVPAGCHGQFGCSPFSQPGQSNPGSACCPYYNDPAQKCSATTADRAWDLWARGYISAIHRNQAGFEQT